MSRGRRFLRKPLGQFQGGLENLRLHLAHASHARQILDGGLCQLRQRPVLLDQAAREIDDVHALHAAAQNQRDKNIFGNAFRAHPLELFPGPLARRDIRHAYRLDAIQLLFDNPGHGS